MHSSVMKRILHKIGRIRHPAICLLRNPDVIRWLYGKGRHTNKLEEDLWGQTILKRRRPDLTLDQQWTNKFGEHICEELYTLLGHTISKPVSINRHRPDLEMESAILEVKTSTFYTEGTAGEKILGCPFKYADIPTLYRKPLQIVCIGGAEHICRTQYGNLAGKRISPAKRRFLTFFRKQGITYVGATDLLREWAGIL